MRGIPGWAAGGVAAAVGVAALGAVLAGCTITIGDGGGPAAVPRYSAAGTPSPAWSIVRPSAPPREIGPKGLGPLDVGMTLDEAAATGEFTKRADKPGTCMSDTGTSGITVGWSGKYGITSLTAENLHTPEGITAGSTFADVTRAYPVPAEPDPAGQDPADQGAGGYLDDLLMFGDIWAAVPGRPDAEYVFVFSRQDLTRATADQAKVMYIQLKLRAQRNC